MTYTALDHAKRCIASVLKHSPQDTEIILTANGNPEVAKYFTELASGFAGIKVIVNEANEGFIGPNIRALEEASGEYFVLLNDDVVVSENWLDLLAAPFAVNHKCALTGPYGGCTGLRADCVGTMNGRVEYLEGSCLMGKTALLRQHGLFDTNLKFAYGEDSDLSLRMRRAGYTIHQVAMKLNHVGAATSNKVPEVRAHAVSNHEYLRRKWSHYLRVRKFNYPILIKRNGALGDVLLLTPIIRALKQRNPQCSIWVETQCPAMLYGNKHIEKLGPAIAPNPDTDVFNLNGAYEMRPQLPYTDAYAEAMGLKVGEWENRLEMELSTADLAWAKDKIPGEYIVFHTGPTAWKCRNWPNANWEQAIKSTAEFHRCVIIGSEVTPGLNVAKALDLRGRTTLGQMAAVVSRAKLLVGIDSLGIHVAQAFGVPVVGLFGLTEPGHVFTEGSPHIAICSDPNHPATGLRHKQAGLTFVDHPSNPMDSISVSGVIAAIAMAMAGQMQGVH